MIFGDYLMDAVQRQCDPTQKTNVLSPQNKNKNIPFLRYPGGKQRQLFFFEHLLPISSQIKGTYVEPFVGGGSVYFYVNPKSAILSDKNKELIDLYKGIRDNPSEVWEFYRHFPETKKGYYLVRDFPTDSLNLSLKAARTLYLNRTCFKGMWRHNSQGKFNVGYGGQDRRWVISEDRLNEISERLSKTKLKCCDFEQVIDSCTKGDFLFLDPPYCPGEKEQQNDHYMFGSFSYDDQKRLCDALKRASKKNISWVMTNSSNTEIKKLYRNFKSIDLKKGTGGSPGILTNNTGEMVFYSYSEE